MGRLALALVGLAVLASASLVVGVGDLDLRGLVTGGADAETLRLLAVSRIPRTVAVILAGASMGIAAVIMQMLFRNRFVEPTTSGGAEAASLGLLAVALLAPDLPVMGKMLVAALFSLAGTALFLLLVDRLPVRSTLIVPLLGIMLGKVIEAVTTFFAYRYDLLQSLAAWTNGDFSGVLRGRYELLWVAAALTALAYLAADRFTVAGLGESFTTNLGLNYRRIVTLGLAVVSLVTAATVVTVGTVPFLGLIVANLVSMLAGDNLRRSMPWIALAGAAFLLASDILGRLVRFPYEVPVGTVVGVVGSGIFLVLLLGRRARFG
ncbi:iron chelate uptake ABC transporter family permease subunit [Propylenella binzhouense]|uniref:ABC transporter permease n=1 Tax=Propylenella binzhouense TaxID=2555902 RepID=A0A964T1U5_9HYPH|nr:ABC transporter permease [Propylenella binzhouense]